MRPRGGLEPELPGWLAVTLTIKLTAMIKWLSPNKVIENTRKDRMGSVGS